MLSLQVATGLCTYFDKALHVRLLYDAEIPQADEVRLFHMLQCPVSGRAHLGMTASFSPDLKGGVVQVHAKGLVACKVYGMPHLLRLLVTLPELVPMNGINTEQRTLLQESLDHFVHHLLTLLVQEHARHDVEQS